MISSSASCCKGKVFNMGSTPYHGFMPDGVSWYSGAAGVDEFDGLDGVLGLDGLGPAIVVMSVWRVCTVRK